MKTQVSFTKLVGAGNDFVMVDQRNGQVIRGLKQLARRICDRHDGVGADGLLVAARARKGHLRMRIFNPDGSEPDMCGNGARCFALFAYQAGWAPKQMRIETGAGNVDAEVVGSTRVVLRLAPPQHFRQHTLVVGGRPHDVASVMAGVPHAVLLVDDIAQVDVEQLGRAVRQHARFRPAGTNVDFIEPTRRFVYMRTYERGVEGETCACGTGAVASAAVLWKYHRRTGPVTIVTRSGAHLKIRFDMADRHIRHAWLEGPARMVFTGSWAHTGSTA